MKKLLVTAIMIITMGIAAHATPESFAPVVKATQDGVVHINTESTVTQNVAPFMQGNPFMDDEMFRKFFGSTPSQREYHVSGIGSGFIIDTEGHIITNNHVIANASDITVRISNSKEFKATVVGTDPLTDLALLKIDAKGVNLKPLKLGDSDKAEIGDWTIAIGSPRGFDWSVTAGIVSAKGRDLIPNSQNDFFQTDAAINPGNSGGPLLNMQGEVIGINTLISSNGQGLGFSVPSNTLKNLLPQLKSGQVRRGYIGVSLQEMDRELAESYGLTEPKGALILQVMKDQPAAKAGLRPGDIVTAADSKVINNIRELQLYIGSKMPGNVVKLTIIRNGKTQTVNVTLGELPTQEKSATPAPVPSEPTGTQFESRDLTPAEKSDMQIDGGAMVTSVRQGSNAEKSGLSAGDVVTWANRQNITSAKQLANVVEKVKKGESISLRVMSNRGIRFIAFEK